MGAFAALDLTASGRLKPGGAVAMADGAYYQHHKCGFWYPLLQLKEATAR